ncbi:23S rRNA pseudouridine(1911/1915/1917) synthase RluD [Sulfuricystis multivorans]|uniref:23S rRNA pseudouridine(1911/1915/1917) synthase RluD n=1 Tax=Sulfuricystis multivorans TaxID=2211108 RepID=UPI0024DFB6CF|nr:23S rRNA pseudouridine(1911/1915/1917) synthase RluD [Sulfuricystis multivorans]
MSPVDYSEITLPTDCAGLRLDAALARLFPEHSRSRLQAWLKSGAIRVDGLPADAKRKVHGGETIRLAVLPAPTLEHAAEDIPLPIIYEDDSLIVIDKPAGLVVHPGNGNERGTLMNALLHHAPELAEVPRAGIVHRLDKDTSGLMVVAKTLAAQTHLVRALAARQVKRHYLALVHGRVEAEGCVDAPIGRHPTQRIKMAVVKQGGKAARTHYAVRERLKRATLLECRLETGRTHQIRVHMASIGHPLVGDPVYGKKKSGDALLDSFGRQALHAFRLALAHPAAGTEMTWESPLPADFTALLEALRAG